MVLAWIPHCGFTIDPLNELTHLDGTEMPGKLS